jgi:hypothetical protein
MCRSAHHKVGRSDSSPGLAIHRPVEVVGERDRKHASGGHVLSAPKIEARLHPARSLDRELGLGQVDLVRGEHELGLR